MPVERVSKGFKDISSSFQVNPLNEDLIAIKNETAIARSMRNLILTYTGERFFNPLLGFKVIIAILFESLRIIYKGGKYYARNKKPNHTITLEGIF